ncbi:MULTISPECIES: Co2+/Mg2+ efflux protein ApaG [Hydrotalea]|jgi:ApaG protein|uniref:ApaG protein n=1 Tax=Hydrotalea sandarakina TaxID=1004304 RepID=A0A2W7S251_9BACT|nr:Co2+/Mg2+ efflux protein ApaG [Hydrotalea sandarakina]PZX61407.1 ApaG protein [Hydrotalea sandarakina]
MITKISSGIQISVETFYQPEYSNPFTNEYMFAYRITIDNLNAFPVKLLRRHWFIYDCNCERREVEGEGVVGVQPIVLPGHQYQYVSGCNFKSEMGKMSGHYTMLNLDTQTNFTVNIPVFEMIAPAKLN